LTCLAGVFTLVRCDLVARNFGFSLLLNRRQRLYGGLYHSRVLRPVAIVHWTVSAGRHREQMPDVFFQSARRPRQSLAGKNVNETPAWTAFFVRRRCTERILHRMTARLIAPRFIGKIKKSTHSLDAVILLDTDTQINKKSPSVLPEGAKGPITD